ncbi:MAG: cadherin-like domain-containing protein, partial [Pseudodesulfovibrio sp.]
DGELNDTGTLTITVTGTNDAPVVSNDTLGGTTYTPSETVEASTPATIANVAQVAAQWASEGITVRAMTGDGLDPSTWQDASLSSKNVSFTEDGRQYAYSGFGVSASGNIDGGEVDTVNGDDNSTELVGVSFEQPMQSVTLTISALFDGIEDPSQPGDDKGPYDGGSIETARVAAYDANGELIGYVDVQGTPNGLVTVVLDAATLGSSTPIAEITVMPLDDGAGHSGNNSDFLVNSVTGETAPQVDGVYLEDHTISIDPSVLLVNDTDVDGDTLTITSVGDATHGAVSLVDGQIVFAPEADYNGQATFTYTVSDGHGGSDTATVTLNITPVNDAPEAGDVSLTLAEDGTLTITEADVLAAASDVDGDDLSVTALSVDGGTLADNGDGTWTFTPAADWSGTLNLNYTVSDGTASTDGSGTITVTPEADAAVIGGKTGGNATEDTQPTAEGQLTITDPDAGEAHFTADTLSGEGHYGTLTIDEAGHWAYTADNASDAVQQLGQGQTLTDQFTVTAADGTGQTISVTIHGTNDTPLAAADSFTVGQAEITDGAPVSVTLPQTGAITDVVNQWAAAGIAISALHGHVTGNDSLQLTDQSADLTLDGQNGIGIAGGLNNEVDYKSDEVLKVSFDEPMTSADVSLNYFYSNDSWGHDELMRVYAYDPDGELIGYVEVEASSSGGLATIHVDAEALGGTTIGSLYLVPVDDGAGNGRWSDNTEFSLQSITATPAVYGGETDADLTMVNGEIHIDPAALLGNDSDIDLNDPDSSLSVTNVSNAVGGSVSMVNGEIVFEPTPGYIGTTSFTYTVSDGHGGSSSATVTLNLPEGNTAPEAGDVSLTMAEDGTLTIHESDILASVTDANGDDLSVTSLSVDGGTLTQTGEGTWSFAPDANFNGTLNLTYTVSDGTASTDGSGTIAVTSVNDAPVLDVDGGAAYTIGGEPVSIAGDITITDVDSSLISQAVITLTNTQAGDVLNTDGVSGLYVDVTHVGDDTIITLSGDAIPTVYESAIKAITFSTTGDADAAREVTVQVTDADGGQSTSSNVATTTISVAEQADDPMWVNDVTGQEVVFVSQNASYSNMLGIYTVDENGNPSEPEIILYNSKDAAPQEVLKAFAQDEQIRFFLIPNGTTLGLDANATLYFVMHGDHWALALDSANGDTDDKIVEVQFDDAQFNQGGEEASFLFPYGGPAGITETPYNSTEIRVDDQTAGDDDNDFNDLVVKVQGTIHGQFEGGNASDYANGGDGKDTLYGNEGNDTLIGGHMDDSLIGGDGDDSLYGDGMFGGTGSDTLDGGAGHDLLEGGDKGDLLIGGDGNDTLYGEGSYGGSGSDTLDGGAGDDRLVGGDKADTLIGGDGNDTLYGDGQFGDGSGADSLDGGAGDDLLIGGDKGDLLIGGDGNDTLYGDFDSSGWSTDHIDGGAGHDLIIGGGANDTLSGGDGNDTIYGAYENDTAWSSDHIDGGAGHDLLVGGHGNDTLYGGAGNDTILGGDDHDLIIASGGYDQVTLGDGNDTIFIDQSVLADGEMIVSDFNVHHDVLELGDGLSISDIIIDDTHDYTQLLISNGESDIVVKLLGVTPADFAANSLVVDTDTHADSLIQMLIDADNKTDF